jgi:hypothetical protein
MRKIFWLENLRGREHSEDIGVDGKIILEWMLGKQDGKYVDWMHLVQDRDQWRDCVNTVMNFRVP